MFSKGFVRKVARLWGKKSKLKVLQTSNVAINVANTDRICFQECTKHSSKQEDHDGPISLT